MSEQNKKIFLAICIIVPFALYCYVYYSQLIRNAPYRFSDFESIVLKYGEGDSLVNHFNSKTGIYQYLNRNDSLVTDTILLREDDLRHLHGKAAQLGFWNLPDDMTSADTTQSPASGTVRATPRFYLQFNYKEKRKTVTLDADFGGNPKMLEAAKSVVDEVIRVINDARDR
ncbi:hypothetical protein [Parapedobacter koreensis]|uniref:Uncharacterized protein n=1 Tax=Parapedobacter koreensis TaxID=332977 RepID=A0A1H7MLW0_9SPHI|nr:hypothetical protein [Parapedobacter koreensis]SEL12300.1 hypothetical protein SAMN05421740_103573 [Parapedobacter koreensis]